VEQTPTRHVWGNPMTKPRNGPDPKKLAAYQGCITRGLTVDQTAEAMGVKRHTVRSYARDNGLVFVDYNPRATSRTPDAVPARDVWVIEKHSPERISNPITMRVSLPKPPFEIDIRRTA